MEVILAKLHWAFLFCTLAFSWYGFASMSSMKKSRAGKRACYQRWEFVVTDQPSGVSSAGPLPRESGCACSRVSWAETSQPAGRHCREDGSQDVCARNCACDCYSLHVCSLPQETRAIAGPCDPRLSQRLWAPNSVFLSHSLFSKVQHWTRTRSERRGGRQEALFHVHERECSGAVNVCKALR